MSGFFNKKKEELPIFTKEEVARHNTRQDTWISVNGKVYDFTNFQYEHPGGQKCESIILRVDQR